MGKENGANGLSNGHVNGYKSHSNGVCNGFHKHSLPVKDKGATYRQEKHEPIPLFNAILVYFSTLIIVLLGHFRDFLSSIGLNKAKNPIEFHRDGYVRLYSSFESFYTRNVYRRVCDAWNQPIGSLPGAHLKVLKRTSTDNKWTFSVSKEYVNCINMGSYNYLGFSENFGERIDIVQKCIEHYKVGVGSTRHELGNVDIHQELERVLANYLGVEDCLVFGMGFATNSANIPSIADKGCLIMSDELNHASLILGCRLSSAVIRTFKHNDMDDLEEKLRKYIVSGQPRTHRPWKKIIILVEGVYSMEGTMINLPKVVELKKRYKTYLYLDEAHSIGAIGKRGKGVCDLFDINPNEIDMMMGTFTKSFAAAGGYIGGRKKLMDHIRVYSHSLYYACSISPPIAQQILSVLYVLLGVHGNMEGRERINILARNTRYFRRKLQQLGFIVYGNDASPVVPLMIYFHPKVAAFVRWARDMGIATVGAGFPATPLLESRIRFCLSASHTKEMLDQVIHVTNELGDILNLKYSREKRNEDEEILY